ncbi:MAG: aminotransferase class I/II-fold pyridoxal phosphate-dependent enzyme [Treponema sp.]|nr:aminotransferase class I/II-fold pyridoxal phosphate-dependent enzyme [Treponema sp.]
MFSSRMSNLHPYIPGEQPHDRVYIKLNANENPYPPAKEVVAALQDFLLKNPKALSLYPDPDSNSLRTAIADMLNKTGGVLCRSEVLPDEKMCRPSEKDAIPFEVTKDMIYCGNGSDEVLSFLFYAFFDSDKTLVLPEHTYSFYPVYAGFYNIPFETISLHGDWTLDTDSLLKRASENDSGVIFANPNAPTAIGMSREKIRALLTDFDPNKVFVVDEAYCDFGGESSISLLSEFKNLVIVRTFSKSLCGAGMRLGFLVANPEVIHAITTVKNSLNHFPVDAVTQVAGIAASQNPAYYIDCAKKIVCERDSFTRFLRERGWILTDSQTNFVFARHPTISGSEVYRKIKEEGILVRHFDTKGIEDYIRITIGSYEEMTALKMAIEKW